MSSRRTVMFVNQASDPIVERLLVPDMAMKVAERFAVEENKRVLVLLTDMTAYADALKEVGVSMERVPATRGYMGDLYSQLAVRYERACDYDGAGSVTVLTVTTMPGDDVTHPVPDNTGYITEGQFYLHDGLIDPFGSLSRLKQQVVGITTREDHGQLMNTMIRLYSGAKDAEQKQAMAFDLSEFDHKLLGFGEVVSRPIHGRQRFGTFFRSTRLVLEDFGRVLRARGVVDEGGTDREVLPERLSIAPYATFTEQERIEATARSSDDVSAILAVA